MSAKVGYSLGPLTPDQIDFLHRLPASVLVATARRQVDFAVLSRQELANRGFDGLGVWVGFKQARTAYAAEAAARAGTADGGAA